jgi:hypothetical protein
VGLIEAVLQPLFEEFILQSQPAYQSFQFLYPVLEGRFLGRLIVELASTILLLPVVQQAWGDVVPAAELDRTAFAAEQLLNQLALEL